MSLRQAKVNQQQREALVDAISAQLEKNYSAGADDGEDFRELALDTAIDSIDLNDDGTGEVIARSLGRFLCSPTGNCPLWVFQKSGSGYRLLLEGFGQRFTIEISTFNHYNDIVISTHGSATSGDLDLYRYEKGGYQYAACYNYNWTSPEDLDKVLDEPILISCMTR